MGRRCFLCGPRCPCPSGVAIDPARFRTGQGASSPYLPCVALITVRSLLEILLGSFCLKTARSRSWTGHPGECGILTGGRNYCDSFVGIAGLRGEPTASRSTLLPFATTHSLLETKARGQGAFRAGAGRRPPTRLKAGSQGEPISC